MNIYVILFSFLSCVSALLEKECLDRVETSKSIGATCSKQLKILCGRHDILLKLWDASSRIIRTGLTATTTQDMGNYDSCLSVDTRIEDTEILGKFCPIQWATEVPRKDLEELVAVMEILPNLSTQDTDNGLEIQGNITERDTKNMALFGSLCISDGCSPEEFNQVFRTYLYPVKSLMKYDCITKNTGRDLTVFELVVTVCLALVLVIMISCTIIHIVYYYRKKGKPNDIVEGFSAFYNGSKLITINTDAVNQIQCMNGLRFISILWIIAGHAFSSVTSEPILNEDAVEKWKTQLYAQYIQTAIFAVDTFFFLSGFFLTYGYLKQWNNRPIVQQITGIPLSYLNRYLRLTPAVGAMFLTSISFFKLLGDGPMWFIANDIINKPCKKYWWRFFSYIQNYYPDDMCYTQTWYLSADMQMFVLAPLVLIPISIFFKKSLRFVMAGLIIFTCALVGITIGIPYLFEDYSNEFNTHSRASSYVVGIIGGVIFHKNRGKVVKIHRDLNIILWMSSLAVMLFLIFYHHDVTANPTKFKSTLFGAIYEPIWCTCILWIVYSCYHGYGGFVNWFLSNPLFQIGARLSYCMYILHGIVIAYSVATVRTYLYFGDYVTIIAIGGYINICIFFSVLWTLTFEGPMIMFNKKLFRWLGSSKKKNELTKGDV